LQKPVPVILTFIANLLQKPVPVFLNLLQICCKNQFLYFSAGYRRQCCRQTVPPLSYVDAERKKNVYK
jgi:hypothetical protein